MNSCIMVNSVLLFFTPYYYLIGPSRYTLSPLLSLMFQKLSCLLHSDNYILGFPNCMMIINICADSNDKVSLRKPTVVVTNSELYFNWKGFGLSLFIPENTLPPKIDSCSITIDATIEGEYHLPQSYHFVSPVYWLRCVPECRFRKPVTLEIQHCAKQKNLSKLNFVKGSSLDHLLPFTFNKAIGCCNTNHGIFPSHSSYGFIELDGFSGYSVTQENSEERHYCAYLYYTKKDDTQYLIDFVVSWNTDAHRSVSGMV